MLVSHRERFKCVRGYGFLRFKEYVSLSIGLYVSPQMTLTADELFVHKICVTYDIETILGRFGPWEVPHAAK